MTDHADELADDPTDQAMRDTYIADRSDDPDRRPTFQDVIDAPLHGGPNDPPHPWWDWHTLDPTTTRYHDNALEVGKEILTRARNVGDLRLGHSNAEDTARRARDELAAAVDQRDRLATTLKLAEQALTRAVEATIDPRFAKDPR